MKANVFSDAMGIIDSSYIEEAAIYQKVKKPIPWVKLAAEVACLLLVVAIIIPIISMKNQNAITDIESKKELTLNEVMTDKTFGVLFPKQILAGYVLEDKPGIYGTGDNAVLRVTFYNYELEDEMIIRIASKEWFHSHEKESVESDTVRYRSDMKQDGSYIYLESGEYIIAYSFSARDIAQIDGFRDMVNSAEQNISY